jgi:PKD repeat protein
VFAGWTTQEASPGVVFTAPGLYQVTLEVCNEGACSTITRTVEVLDPGPYITAMSVSPLVVEEGQLVALSGGGTGRPPVALSWHVALAGVDLAILPGEVAWWDTAGFVPGAYTVSLEATNGTGQSLLSAPVPVVVLPRRGSEFYTLTPCRVLDTRVGSALGSLPLAIPVGGRCGVPIGARAVAANVTVVEGTSAGQVVLYPGNYPEPPTSTVAFAPGRSRANNAVIALASDGSGLVTAKAVVPDGGTVHLILDVSGYFLPEP